MATFRKRLGPKGKTVWQVQVIRVGHPGQYRTFDTKGKAEAWARQVESAMDRGEWADRTEGDRTTLAAALERYAREIIGLKAPSTQIRDRRRINTLRVYPIARFALSKLGGKEVAAHILHRQEEGVGANAIRLELALISHLYTVARSAWGMSYLTNPVPLAKTARPRLPAGRDRRLRDGEEAALLAAAPPVLRAVIRWALATTMRLSEISALTWEQIDTTQRSAHVPTSKNGDARTVPLSREALAVLKSIPRQLDGSVFGMSENAISLAWHRARRAVGIKGLTFHDLRHEAISRLFERTDLDAMEIARISGHRTLSMLSRYTHLRAHHLAQRLDGVARGQVRTDPKKKKSGA